MHSKVEEFQQKHAVQATLVYSINAPVTFNTYSASFAICAVLLIGSRGLSHLSDKA